MKQSKKSLKPFIEEAKYLMKLPEEKRVEYVRKVLLSLANAVGKVMAEKNKIKRLKLLKKLQKEFESNKETIIVCLLYTIKDEFRDIVLKIMDAVSGKTVAVS